ncbi:ATP-binding protein [Clostridium chromiireducens]|uniref:ATP-binding protein n=2 Tax=Clostridium chromiireducens TaxID=225345 RepID=A0A1V4IBP1_9CLOT|nr:ATP-binding protein [Clostridium chromiireducens]MVX65803.1 ATP-binding protein [Clostridium chromiireducens]OPJ57356.1 anti-sigma F factor [Clostridium chromiireducens]RII32254.1 ATP-binding protein [Clostridium chromiireducens]
MSDTSGKVVFYGVSETSQKLDYIMKALELRNQHFEIKLIISEAITNAYTHGNNSDKNKPIYVEWEVKDNLLSIKVEDCGQGVKDKKLHEEISEEKILDESGRGLFIINSYADELIFSGNTIIMKKYLLQDIND